jgi:hypothetical protein
MFTAPLPNGHSPRPTWLHTHPRLLLTTALPQAATRQPAVCQCYLPNEAHTPQLLRRLILLQGGLVLLPAFATPEFLSSLGVRADESDADTMRRGRSGSGQCVLGLRLQLDRMGLGVSSADQFQYEAHPSCTADFQQQSLKASSIQAPLPVMGRSASFAASMTVPSLSVPVLHQQSSSTPTSQAARLPGTQFVV